VPSTDIPEERERQMAAAEKTGDGAGPGAQNVGRIVEIKGVVLDVAFPEFLPEIYNALAIPLADVEGAGGGEGRILIAEVQQHLGDNRVAAVAMDATDGLARGAEAIDTGGPITVPVGDATLGRIFNVLGATIDKGDDTEVRKAQRWPIHREPPDFADLTPTPEILETGIKVGRPARALHARRQDRPVRRRRRRQDGADPGAHQQHRHPARRAVRLRGRGRADPRGQRPLARDDRVGRDLEDGARLRADERAAGRAAARGAVGA
jgi:hypothetical protein